MYDNSFSLSHPLDLLVTWCCIQPKEGEELVVMCVRDIQSRWTVFSFFMSFEYGQLEYTGHIIVLCLNHGLRPSSTPHTYPLKCRISNLGQCVLWGLVSGQATKTQNLIFGGITCIRMVPMNTNGKGIGGLYSYMLCLQVVKGKKKKNEFGSCLVTQHLVEVSIRPSLA